MRQLTFIAGAFGIGLTIWMLGRFGLHDILGLVAAGGWSIPAIIAFHATQVCASAQAWRLLAQTGRRRLSFTDFVALRCAREGINNLLPVAQVGGEVITTRLLARREGLGIRRAAASTICDLTIELLSQVTFTLMGLGLLFCLVNRSPITDELMESAGCAVALGAVFLGSQYLGAISLVEKLLVRIAAHLGWDGVEDIRGLHDEILTLYRTRENSLRAGAMQLLGWSLGTFEVFVILRAMGHPLPLSDSFVIESVGQAAKSAGFAVPGALGVSEGGYIIIGGLFGLSPQVGIALSLIKRLREIAWGLPSLVAWQAMEIRWVRPDPAAAKEIHMPGQP
ncbi:lysylphosphatidylglycerol synthase domain-containing protein [Komagataeibacter sp. FNDCF1]|uniref:lysylphosphatidylglycerol synthase domain-containing protein n=1 Tax=Komagataeibacter sp. FNDCF1 TaxID=2878681 RepID=UPI001E4B3F74|nr:lysylphosphatidylglycerol synthase domain-containing protein [Komagataeibacter sp. FNDCF1]MCE2565300.1 lysylphosphatidylglycerol synthase domain-containing protein [Komagataeibacter sp. FNDCF1]